MCFSLPFPECGIRRGTSYKTVFGVLLSKRALFAFKEPHFAGYYVANGEISQTSKGKRKFQRCTTKENAEDMSGQGTRHRNYIEGERGKTRAPGTSWMRRFCGTQLLNPNTQFPFSILQVGFCIAVGYLFGFRPPVRSHKVKVVKSAFIRLCIFRRSSAFQSR